MQILEDTTMLYIVLLALAVGTTADSQDNHADCVKEKAVEGKAVIMTFTLKQDIHTISDIRFKNSTPSRDIFTCDWNSTQYDCDDDDDAFKFHGTANNSVMVIIHNVTLDMTDVYVMAFISNTTGVFINDSTCYLHVSDDSKGTVSPRAQATNATAASDLQTMLYIVLPVSAVAVIILIIAATLCCCRDRLKRICSDFRPRSHSYLVQKRADMPDRDKTELGEVLENATDNLAKPRDSVCYEHYAKSPYPRPRHKRSEHEVSGKPLLDTSDCAQTHEDITSKLHEGKGKPLQEVYADTASSEDTKHKPHERDDKPLLEACDTVNPSEDIDNKPYEDSDKPRPDKPMPGKPRPCGSSAIRLPGDIDNMPWYFGMIPKEEETRLLLSPGNGHGSFIIRDSNSVANQYTLAVRFGYRVSCYRINRTEELSGFYIEDGVVFPALSDLVEYYSEHAGCLQDPLSKPCQRNRESVYLKAV